MSIVVAVKKNDRTVMAADSLNVFGQERVPTDNAKATKVRRVGPALMAVTGWSVYANILDDLLADVKTPPLGDEKEIFTFFLELWRELHERYPFVNDQPHHKDSPFGDLDASFLVANSTGIYKVSQDSSVCRFDKYYAIGSGCVYALGALYQIYDQEHDAATLSRRAVETAIEFDIYCGGEIDLFDVE
ncbi:MAG: Ntn hydrolase family protein [Planctomycetota bacterium]|jgi:ATP-dependent protease HslVU (ClpYQ) peptidase subunit